MRPGNTEIEPELDAPQYNQRLLYTGWPRSKLEHTGCGCTHAHTHYSPTALLALAEGAEQLVLHLGVEAFASDTVCTFGGLSGRVRRRT